MQQFASAQIQESSPEYFADLRPPWTRPMVVSLSHAMCTTCQGTGTRSGRRSRLTCRCVLRNVFDRVRAFATNAVHQEGNISQVSYIQSAHSINRRSYGMPVSEFRADFNLVVRRAIQKRFSNKFLADLHLKIFDLHLSRGFCWYNVAQLVGLDRGNFFHCVYRIKMVAGRAFVEGRVPLYPINEYFSIPPTGESCFVDRPLPARRSSQSGRVTSISVSAGLASFERRSNHGPESDSVKGFAIHLGGWV